MPNDLVLALGMMKVLKETTCDFLVSGLFDAFLQSGKDKPLSLKQKTFRCGHKQALMGHQGCQSRCRSQSLNEAKHKIQVDILRDAAAATAGYVGLSPKLKRLTIDRNGKSFIIFNPF